MMQRTLGGAALCVVVLGAGCVGERASDAGQWSAPPRHEPPTAESTNTKKRSPGMDGSVSAAPGEGASENDLAAQVERDLADLQTALEERESARVAATPRSEPGVSAADVVRADDSPASETGGAPVSTSSTATSGGSAVIEGEGGVASANVEEAIDTGESAARTSAMSAVPIDERVESAAAQLAVLLEEWAQAESGGARALLALGAMEALQEGALSEDALAQLGEEDAEGMRAWAALHRDAARRAASGETDPGMGAVRASAPASERMLGVDTAILCTKVEGFGRYQTLDTSALLAGRGQRAIVYAEVSGFAHRAMTNERGEPGWMVELTQELALYHDADQVLAWRRPEQVISDFSRNKRRDFFVVQMVELPSTLSIGAYNLKVTMRDREGGAVAEAIIPLRVVADPALTRGSR